MAVFSSGGIGFDLGSGNVTVWLENEGVVLREPGFILTGVENDREILAVGREARQMLGRTPKEVVLETPVIGGAVADEDRAAAMIQALAERAVGRRRSLDRVRMAVTMPYGLTRVETEALKRAVRAAGARKAFLVYAPVAAAVGAGLNLNEPRGTMMISVGAGTTQIAVLSANGIAAARTVRTGGTAFDQAIVRYIRREKGLVIGLRTAEDLKIDIGSVVENRMNEGFEVLLRGRNAATGKPATVSVTAKEVSDALQPPTEAILESIREAFENTPPELAADIMERGIRMTGGGALLDGLAKRLSDLTKLNVRVGDTPQDEAATGAGMIAADDRLFARMTASGCVTEI